MDSLWKGNENGNPEDSENGFNVTWVNDRKRKNRWNIFF